MRTVSHFYFAAYAFIFVIWKKDGLHEKTLTVFGGASLAWLLSQGINMVYPVARPFVALSDVVPLFTHGGYDSFPSGHATFAFALAAGIFYWNKPWGVLAVLAAFLIGVSRVIAGVHWPGDSIGGAVLGVVVVVSVHLLYQKTKDLFALMRTGR